MIGLFWELWVDQPSAEKYLPALLSNLPSRICDVATEWIERTPDHPALVESGGTWTYGELSLAIDEARQWLAEGGVRAGDRVIIVCENCRALVAVLFGLGRLDAWPVMVNARISQREIDEIGEHSGARRLIYTVAVSPQARAHSERHGARVVELPWLGRIGINRLNEHAAPEPVSADPAQNVAALVYTSGSTGHPKGVMLTHRNLLFVAAVVGGVRAFTAADRVYGVLPISHIVGLAIVLLSTLLTGGALYLAPRFDPAAVLAGLERDGLTAVFGAPAMFGLLAQYARLRSIDVATCPALRLVHSTGAPLDAATKAAAERLFGMALHQGYGITECAPTIAQTRIGAPRADTSVGPVIPGIEVKLIGADGAEVGCGEVGELRVRGPGVMKGYYKAPGETAAAIDPEGWFNTGDLARFEDDNLFIVGRTKELILRSGFNVVPGEVEGVLNGHPAVEQSAVIGHPVIGDEEIIAFVKAAAGSAITAAALADYAAARLAPYKRPTKIILVAALPMSPTGKVLKDQLAASLVGTPAGPNPLRTTRNGA
jgi:long-chain acyl-CoA synthetase